MKRKTNLLLFLLLKEDRSGRKTAGHTDAAGRGRNPGADPHAHADTCTDTHADPDPDSDS